MVKLVPLRGSDSAKMKPPDCLTMPYTVERPSPVPFPTSLVVKKGSKILPMMWDGMPMPVSVTLSAV